MAEITPQVPLDSVLSISITHYDSIARGSGALFSSGLYVLTAAHLFDDYISGDSINIISANGTVLNDAEVYIHHGWDSADTDYNNDIAIIRLSSASASSGLPLSSTETYEGLTFTLTGFGNEGSLHTGTNIFDGDASLFNGPLNKDIVSGTQVIYDYDNHLEHQNSSKNIFNINSSSTPTSHETLAKAGDSGGGLLVNNQIAAISSYIFRDSRFDVNSTVDSSFGELGIATLVEPYIPWITYITEGNPTYSAPDIASDVITSVAEPFSSSVINYFLLSTSVVSSKTMRFSYVTRDGTATSGIDYEQAHGWVELLPYETNIAIGITIYGDTVVETNETFSLVLTDPTNEWLGMNVELIASHTIINNEISKV